MRIAVLTSSRADYGIYRPLLKKLEANDFFDLKIIAFGTHVSRFHGYTLNKIEEDFKVAEKVETLILGDSEEAVSNAIGNTITKFSSIWNKLKNEIDIVLVLGDRYEMFAAVAASVPFNIKIAHLHGGETSLGAIDNVFRHSITQMSSYHFTATKEYANRVASMIGTQENTYHVGALSLDNLQDLELYTVQSFKETFNIDLNRPTILNTLHPETVHPEFNERNAKTLAQVFETVSKDYQIVITMPNADTYGSLIRNILQDLIDKNDNVIGVESFGVRGYFSCIRHCSFLLGNTSSGLIEAPSLGKYVINIGNRQDGRARSKNVIDTPIEYDLLLNTIERVRQFGDYTGSNVYQKSKKSVSDEIITILKSIQ